MDGHRNLTLFRELETWTDVTRFTVKSRASNPIPVDVISWRDGKPLSDGEELKMSRTGNSKPDIFMKHDSFVGVLKACSDIP